MRIRSDIWVDLPWGTYRLNPVAIAAEMICLLGAVLLLWSAGRFVRSLEAVDAPPLVAGDVRPAPFDEPEPLSRLFGLDTTGSAPFVLLSTLLGSAPRATVSVGDSTFSVAVGDTVEGAVVDSIGRRVVLVRFDTEVVRVEL